MNHAANHPFRNYLLALCACLVVIIACRAISARFVYAPLVTLVLTLLTLVALLLAIILSVEVHAMRNERRDWDETCRPIIARYEAEGDADVLVASYESWRLGQHTSVLRFDFLEEICRLLARDGYAADTRVALSLLADMARTPVLCRRFWHLRAECSDALSRSAQAR